MGKAIRQIGCRHYHRLLLNSSYNITGINLAGEHSFFVEETGNIDLLLYLFILYVVELALPAGYLVV